jgi:hypothetical protein
MGACCIGARPAHAQSIFSITNDGWTMIEYSVTQDLFYEHQFEIQIPAMSKYCEILHDKVLITGGFKRLKGKLGEPVSDVYIFSKDCGLQKLESLESPRTGHCLVPSSGLAYLISGVISHIQPTTSCYKFDYFCNTWSEIAPISKPRVLASGCFSQNSIFITGGNPGNSLQNFRDIEQYIISNNTWKVLELKLPCDIWRHTCLPFSEKGLIIFGGNCNKRHNLDSFQIDLTNSIITQQTWLRQGLEFSGCNFSNQFKVYALESSNCSAVWIFSNSKWTSRVRSESSMRTL